MCATASVGVSCTGSIVFSIFEKKLVKKLEVVKNYSTGSTDLNCS
jgi:hypothetical protein